MDTLQQTYSSALPLALDFGANTTDAGFVTVYKFRDGTFSLPDRGPYILAVLSGKLRLHTIGGVVEYRPGDIVVSAIVTPETGLTVCNGGLPFVAVRIDISSKDVVSIMIDLDDDTVSRVSAGEPADSSTEMFLDAVHRLLEAVRTDRDGFLLNHIRREIVYTVITGPMGREFVSTVLDLGEAGEMYAVNSWIKRNFREDFTVQELADRLCMSSSTFHRRFKSAVGMGPIQCQKILRLTEARRLMLEESCSERDAASAVGYDSLPQFVRDYGNAFGTSPSKDVRSLQERLGLRE